MIKLYYDCPIKALYMMKNFNVKIQIDRSIYAIARGFMGVAAPQIVAMMYYDEETCSRFYIRPDSYDTFKPKQYDIIQSDFKQEGRLVSYIEDTFCIHIKDVGTFKTPINEATIIQRNKKLFFTPKTEIKNEQ